MNSIYKFILICIFLAFSFNAFSQSYTRDWVKRFNYWNNGIDMAYSVTVDDFGNSYITGHSWGSIRTIKYNSSGVQQWVQSFEGQGTGELANVGYSIAVGGNDGSGNPFVYVAGSSRNKNGDNDIITLKYTTSGSLSWSTIYAGPAGGDDVAKQVVIDEDGNIYVTGKSQGGSTFNDWVTIKYNTEGTQVWATRFHDEEVYRNDEPAALFCAGGPTVYVTGVVENSNGNFDIETIAYNGENGNVIWIAEPYPGYDQNWTNLEHRTIAADNSIGVYVTGVGYGGVLTLIKYDPRNGTELWDRSIYYGAGLSLAMYLRRLGYTWNHTDDIFATGEYWDGQYWQYGVLKYSADGDEFWKRGYHHSTNSGAEYGQSICVDYAENVCATGLVYNNNGSADYATVIYDKMGNKIYEDIYDGGNGSDIAHDNAVDMNGNFYVTGESEGGVSNSDYVTIKYMTTGDNPNIVQPLNNNNNELSSVPSDYFLYQNYPNPFNPSTTIRYAIPQNGFVIINVYDMLGRIVATPVNEFKEAGYYQVSFDGTKLSSGVYFYKLQAGNFIEMKKMILLK